MTIDDIKSVSVDADHQKLLIETCAPWNKVMRAIESSDRKAVLMGIGVGHPLSAHGEFNLCHSYITCSM
jgi:hypothetical protein